MTAGRQERSIPIDATKAASVIRAQLCDPSLSSTPASCRFVHVWTTITSNGPLPFRNVCIEGSFSRKCSMDKIMFSGRKRWMHENQICLGAIEDVTNSTCGTFSAAARNSLWYFGAADARPIILLNMEAVTVTVWREVMHPKDKVANSKVGDSSRETWRIIKDISHWEARHQMRMHCHIFWGQNERHLSIHDSWISLLNCFNSRRVKPWASGTASWKVSPSKPEVWLPSSR
jgi:hypothetical protein